jgi:hypothetical protein
LGHLPYIVFLGNGDYYDWLLKKLKTNIFETK